MDKNKCNHNIVQSENFCSCFFGDNIIDYNYYPTKESKKGGSAAYEDTLNIWRPNQPIPEIKKG